jgi:hypothetical protein
MLSFGTVVASVWVLLDGSNTIKYAKKEVPYKRCFVALSCTTWSWRTKMIIEQGSLKTHDIEKCSSSFYEGALSFLIRLALLGYRNY